MADIIVQPKVKKEDGSYDDLIMQNAKNATNDSDGNNITTTYATNALHPIQYTKVSTSMGVIIKFKSEETAIISLSETMDYGKLYKIVYRNYDLNIVDECFISDQGGSWPIISSATSFTYSFNTGTPPTLYETRFMFYGNIVESTEKSLHLTLRLLQGQAYPSEGKDRIQILAVYRVDGYPSIS